MIRPLRDILVLRPLTEPGRYGSLYLPDLELSGNKSSVTCEVLAAGPGHHERHLEGSKAKVPGADTGDTWRGRYKRRFHPTTVKPGDRVSIVSYGAHCAGEEIRHEGETLVLIRERDINGIAT